MISELDSLPGREPIFDVLLRGNRVILHPAEEVRESSLC